MKRILFILLALLSINAFAQISPGLHTVINKPVLISTTAGAPFDALSMFYDATNFLYRDYQSLAEARTYLTATKWRVGNHVIFIHSGGTLNSNGTYTGGSTQFYLWANGTSDNALIPLFDFLSAGFLGTNTSPVDSNYNVVINVNGKLRGDTNLVWNPVAKIFYSYNGEIDFASGVFNHTRAVISAKVPNLPTTVTDSLGAMNIGEFYRRLPAGGSGTWGGITGTLANQTDLQTALNLKANIANPFFSTGITVGNGTYATRIEQSIDAGETMYFNIIYPVNGIFRVRNNNGTVMSADANNVLTVGTLAGSGTRVVVASPSGALSTQTINTDSISSSQYYTSGSTFTIGNSTAKKIVLYVNPASTLATSTITFPPTLLDQQEIEIHFGGTITSGNVVTTLALVGNGKTIGQNTTPSNLEAYEYLSYVYNSSNNTLYRKN